MTTTLNTAPRYLASRITDTVNAYELWKTLGIQDDYERWLDDLLADCACYEWTDWLREGQQVHFSVQMALMAAALARHDSSAAKGVAADLRAHIAARAQADLSGFDCLTEQAKLDRAQRSYCNRRAFHDLKGEQTEKFVRLVWLVSNGHVKVGG